MSIRLIDEHTHRNIGLMSIQSHTHHMGHTHTDIYITLVYIYSIYPVLVSVSCPKALYHLESDTSSVSP